MKRIALAASLVLFAGCASSGTDPVAQPTSAAPTQSTPKAPPKGAIVVPENAHVVRGLAPDGWPVFVVGRTGGSADVFGAIAQVGPGRLGDEVGWCHFNSMFEATTRGRRYDDTGHSVTGIGGLARYAAQVVDGYVIVGARGDVTTGKAQNVPRIPCARRALLTPDYPAPVAFGKALKSSGGLLRVAGLLTLSGGRGSLCSVDSDPCVDLGDRFDPELLSRSYVNLKRTFWLAMSAGKPTAIGLGSGPKVDTDDSSEEQFGYLVRVDGDWIYFDRAEILLGAAAVAAAKADGKPAPGDGEHYLRNNNPRLRRYRVDAQTRVNVGNAYGNGPATMPALREAAKEHPETTLYTSKGKLLQIGEEGCN